MGFFMEAEVHALGEYVLLFKDQELTGLNLTSRITIVRRRLGKPLGSTRPVREGVRQTHRIN